MCMCLCLNARLKVVVCARDSRVNRKTVSKTETGAGRYSMFEALFCGDIL